MPYKVLEFNVCGGGILSLVKEFIHYSTSNIKYDIESVLEFENQSDIKFFEKKDVQVNIFHENGNQIKKLITRCKNLYRLIKQNQYDCIHIHNASYYLFIFGIVSKCAGVKKIVFHSHSTGCGDGTSKAKNIFHLIFRPFLKYIGTDFCACSYQAAKWMFPNIKIENIHIINNGIDLNRFKIDNDTRSNYRQKLGIVEDDKIIGHVGRFDDNKNQALLVKILKHLKEIDDKYKLLFIGDGETKCKVMELVDEMKMNNCVLFTGSVDNVQDYMQAMDIFILPSKFEGLPIVGVEAQACGLPVIFSTGVPEDAKLTENVEFLQLNDLESWVIEIQKMIALPKEFNTNIIRTAGFDIYQTVESVERIYLST